MPKTNIKNVLGRRESRATSTGEGEGVEGNPVIMAHVCFHLHDFMSILIPP